MNNPELRDKLRIIVTRNGKSGRIPELLEDELDKLEALIQQETVIARLAERNQVALDNYRGHTFGETTNWEGKFAKFISNNENRLAQLSKGDTE